MLTPEALLDHAWRLLLADSDEADAWRVISACYYAVFNLFISEAAALQPGSGDLQGAIRRSMQHRDVRRVCDAIATRFGARPAALQRLLVEPVGRDLIDVVAAFAELQNGRFKADYDLVARVTRLDALEALFTARTVVEKWPAPLPDPNTRTFLLALLFLDRLTRRT